MMEDYPPGSIVWVKLAGNWPIYPAKVVTHEKGTRYRVLTYGDQESCIANSIFGWWECQDHHKYVDAGCSASWLAPKDLVVFNKAVKEAEIDYSQRDGLDTSDGGNISSSSRSLRSMRKRSYSPAGSTDTTPNSSPVCPGKALRMPSLPRLASAKRKLQALQPSPAAEPAAEADDDVCDSRFDEVSKMDSPRDPRHRRHCPSSKRQYRASAPRVGMTSGSESSTPITPSTSVESVHAGQSVSPGETAVSSCGEPTAACSTANAMTTSPGTSIAVATSTTAADDDSQTADVSPTVPPSVKRTSSRREKAAKRQRSPLTNTSSRHCSSTVATGHSESVDKSKSARKHTTAPAAAATTMTTTPQGRTRNSRRSHESVSTPQSDQQTENVPGRDAVSFSSTGSTSRTPTTTSCDRSDIDAGAKPGKRRMAARARTHAQVSQPVCKLTEPSDVSTVRVGSNIKQQSTSTCGQQQQEQQQQQQEQQQQQQVLTGEQCAAVTSNMLSEAMDIDDALSSAKGQTPAVSDQCPTQEQLPSHSDTASRENMEEKRTSPRPLSARTPTATTTTTTQSSAQLTTSDKAGSGSDSTTTTTTTPRSHGTKHSRRSIKTLDLAKCASASSTHASNQLQQSVNNSGPSPPLSSPAENGISAGKMASPPLLAAAQYDGEPIQLVDGSMLSPRRIVIVSFGTADDDATLDDQVTSPQSKTTANPPVMTSSLSVMTSSPEDRTSAQPRVTIAATAASNQTTVDRATLARHAPEVANASTQQPNARRSSSRRNVDHPAAPSPSSSSAVSSSKDGVGCNNNTSSVASSHGNHGTTAATAMSGERANVNVLAVPGTVSTQSTGKSLGPAAPMITVDGKQHQHQQLAAAVSSTASARRKVSRGWPRASPKPEVSSATTTPTPSTTQPSSPGAARAAAAASQEPSLVVPGGSGAAPAPAAAGSDSQPLTTTIPAGSAPGENLTAAAAAATTTTSTLPKAAKRQRRTRTDSAYSSSEDDVTTISQKRSAAALRQGDSAGAAAGSKVTGKRSSAKRKCEQPSSSSAPSAKGTTLPTTIAVAGAAATVVNKEASKKVGDRRSRQRTAQTEKQPVRAGKPDSEHSASKSRKAKVKDADVTAAAADLDVDKPKVSSKARPKAHDTVKAERSTRSQRKKVKEEGKVDNSDKKKINQGAEAGSPDKKVKEEGSVVSGANNDNVKETSNGDDSSSTATQVDKTTDSVVATSSQSITTSLQSSQLQQQSTQESVTSSQPPATPSQDANTSISSATDSTGASAAAALDTTSQLPKVQVSSPTVGEDDDDDEDDNEDSCSSSSDSDFLSQSALDFPVTPAKKLSDYAEGNIVWVRIGNTPFWPAMVKREARPKKPVVRVRFFEATGPGEKSVPVRKATHITHYSINTTENLEVAEKELDGDDLKRFQGACLKVDELLRKRAYGDNQYSETLKLIRQDSSAMSSSSASDVGESLNSSFPADGKDVSSQVQALQDNVNDALATAAAAAKAEEEKDVKAKVEFSPAYGNLVELKEALTKSKKDLLLILAGKLPSVRHQKFSNSNKTRSSLKETSGFGPITDFDVQQFVHKEVRTLFYAQPGMLDTGPEAYVYDVWLPEFVIRYIMLVEAMNYKTAEEFFLSM